MIKLEHTSVMNFENAIRGMRNSMNSWDRSDSRWGCPPGHMYPHCGEDCRDECEFIIGENDLVLAERLTKSGSDHRKFLRQIFVSVDVTAPLYWWKEYDTYKVGTVANSCSTMHKIHAKEFTLDDFSHERLHERAERRLAETIEELNFWRDIYNNGGWVDNSDGTAWVYNPRDMDAWHNMIQLLPSSYNQMRTCTLNYENLVNIYHARRNHKLDEWRAFCGWIESLPYAKELICGEDDNNGNE